MTDRPIIFSAPMVRALLEGRKTQTRRVMKSIKGELKPGDLLIPNHGVYRARYLKGDRLWVRESFTKTQFDKPVYRADARDSDGQRWSSIMPGDPDNEVLWKPAIHMPRWASRMTLMVADVRFQRLQEIDGFDATTEGAQWLDEGRGAEKWGVPGAVPFEHPFPRDAFRALWSSIHGPEAWDANPWVVALTFDVIKQNIDQVQP